MQHINSWKNKEVFEDQLSLNERELHHYPNHWNQFINSVISSVGLKKATLLDLGCGSGSYKELCKRQLPNINYTGMDYSEEAIEVAKQRWKGEDWIVGDYRELTSEYANNYDILHTGAMLDVLPNGDEALSFLLTLGFKNIILGRVKLIEEASGFTEYTAYNKIQTYAYSHNIQNLKEMIEEANYEATFTGDLNSCTILLKKSPSV